MIRKRKDQASHESHERWLLTYADLITLLLAFFVVMYSMSQVDAKKFGAMSTALGGILRGQGRPVERPSSAELFRGGALKTGEMRLMQQQLQQKLNQAEMTASVSTDVSERGLVIHVREGALFDEGKADLTAGAVDVLRTIGGEIRDIDNHVRVEGHTDPRPINTARFPSNWELSAARATSVLRFLVDSVGFAPIRISAVGYGEFRPVAANESAEQMALNRRVDIVILSQQLSQAEPEGKLPPSADTAASRVAAR